MRFLKFMCWEKNPTKALKIFKYLTLRDFLLIFTVIDVYILLLIWSAREMYVGFSMYNYLKEKVGITFSNPHFYYLAVMIFIYVEHSKLFIKRNHK